MIVSTKKREALNSDPIANVDPVEAYDYANRAVSFFSVPKAKQIDYIMNCTGYQYDHTFFKTSRVDTLILAGTAVPDLFQHVIYKTEPTLAFIGIPKMTASFVVAEVQSPFVARMFTKTPDTIPSESAMADFEHDKAIEWSQHTQRPSLPPQQKMSHNLG